MGASYQAKVTVSGLGLKTPMLEKIALGSDDAVAVARFYGFAQSQESVDTTFGTSVCFKGEIEAQNMITGEVVRSGKMYLPEIAEAPLCNAITALEEGEKLKFGLEITVEQNRSAKGGCKYKYGVKSLIELGQDDELAKMRLQLPAPGAAPAKKGKK